MEFLPYCIPLVGILGTHASHGYPTLSTRPRFALPAARLAERAWGSDGKGRRAISRDANRPKPHRYRGGRRMGPGKLQCEQSGRPKKKNFRQIRRRPYARPYVRMLVPSPLVKASIRTARIGPWVLSRFNIVNESRLVSAPLLAPLLRTSDSLESLQSVFLPCLARPISRGKATELELCFGAVRQIRSL